MLTQQFFTRVQLAKILNFKNDGSIRDLEKKGFITPEIKPSKYTFNQVLFMMICKEITNFTDLSWKDFIDADFYHLLTKNIIEYDLIYLERYDDCKEPHIVLVKDPMILENLNNYLEGDLYTLVPKLKGSENITYEDIPSFHLYQGKGHKVYMWSIDKIYQKLQNKCVELQIDLNEKIRA